MPVGIIIGAWLYYKYGRNGVMRGVFTFSVAGVLDFLWGREIGMFLGRSARDLIQWLT